VRLELSKTRDAFESAEFWLLKGQAIHTKIQSDKPFMLTAQDTNMVALDFYLSGVKSDPKHYGCVYNVACSYFMESKFVNALKWFDLALRLRPNDGDSLLGKAIVLLKLGKHDEAIKLAEYLYSNKSITTSGMQTSYQPEQFTLLYCVCCKINNDHERAFQVYREMSGGIRKRWAQKLRDGTTSLMLLPLEKNRRRIESIVGNFEEHVCLFNRF